MLLLTACNGQSEQNPPQPPTIPQPPTQLPTTPPPPPSENIADALTRFNSVSFEFFDTITQVIGYAESREEFDAVNALIQHELLRMHQLFDIYNEYPNLNNLRTINQNAGLAHVSVDPILIELIERSIDAYHLTNGTVNIALGPVLEIWHTHRHADTPTLPDMELLQAANTYTNIHDIVVDAENGTVFLPYENMSLDVGGIAKGFALEIVARLAQDAGFQSFLVNMGGDVIVADPPPEREFWNVGVEDPVGETRIVDVVSVTNMAVFASGDYRRYLLIDDIPHGHIIDPDTLMPAKLFRAVSVIHPSALYAEILSTAVFIIDIDSGIELLAEHGAEGIWITDDGQAFTTPGYSRFSDGF